MDITYSTIIFVTCLFWVVQGSSLRRPNQSNGARIIGGHEVKPHSIPYQAFLNVTGPDGSTWRCGGSLISTNYVLTAARCCAGSSSVTVILGVHNLNEKNIYQVTYENTTCTINSKFTTNVYNFVYIEDVAVVALPEPVELNNFVQTVRLPNPYDWTERFVNKTGRISGWGLTDGYNKSSYSSVLLAQETRIMGDSECMYSHFDLHNYDICVVVNETNSPCIGDYGSPLTVDDVQVGIASQGIDNCDPSVPFIYTRISDFLTWIKGETDYVDDYTTVTTETPETTSKASSASTASTSKTTTSITTTDATETTTGRASRSYCLVTLLLLNLVLLICTI